MGLPLNILLVEDDADDQLLIEELLSDVKGYAFTLKWETSHKGGLQRLRSEKFDICLVDYRIGAHSGTEFITAAKELDSDLPIILITGISDQTIDFEASEVGAANFVEKANLTSENLERAIRYSIVRMGQIRLRRLQLKLSQSGLEQELREAISDQQFEVYLQPEIHCETQRIRKAEALVRWNHPKHGVLLPHHFIEQAEQTGLIFGIGKIVLGQVCRISNRLNALGNKIKVALNVSVSEFERRDFAAHFEQVLIANGTDPATIELEITESVAMRDPELVRSHLKHLKDIGITFAIDDFGTGHSGLSSLKDFPFDTIKIDRSFVQTAEQSARDRAIAKTIFYLADVMRLDTVAEGVETEAQLAFVRNYGATYAQGFLFSKPVPFDAFQQFVRRFDIEQHSEVAPEGHSVRNIVAVQQSA